MNNVIETKHLSRYFGEGEILVKALNDATITIKAGEFTAIIGPSGSGKSTLLQLIGGLDQPTSGDVFLDGKKISNGTPGPLWRTMNDLLQDFKSRL